MEGRQKIYIRYILFIDNSLDFNLYYIFLSFSNPFAIFILIITAVSVSYKIAKNLLDHMYKNEDRFLALHRNYEKEKLLFLTLPIIGLITIIGSSFLFDYLIFKLNNTSVEILGSIPTVIYQIIICFIQFMFTAMFLIIFIYTIWFLYMEGLQNK